MLNWIYIIAGYALVVFGISRLIIPHLNSRPIMLPEEIPDEMLKKIAELKEKSNSAEEFLKLAYDFIGTKYYSHRLNTLLKFQYLWLGLPEAWNSPGYLPCTVSSFILSVFLIKSGYFTADDIKKRRVFVNFVPHQYLKVKLGEKWIDVDVGEKERGLPIGKHLKWFG